MEVIGSYKNGNVFTTLFRDGTKIRHTEDDEFRPDFAENMDIKICDRCDIGCPWCAEGSTPNGKLGDILNEKFIDTLHPYQEAALGGGDVLEHPDLIPFLQKLKDRNVVANITLNQRHFENNIGLVDKLVKKKLIWGLGVSLVEPTEKFIALVKQYPNAVIHVINGIFSPKAAMVLGDNNLKLLILGYKDLRRGSEWLEKDYDYIEMNQGWVSKNIKYITDKFKVVSFDNLAIEQLGIKEQWSSLSDRPWEEFYAGDDGTNTYFIDIVEKKFARSSTAPMDERYDLLDNVDDMFAVIKKKVRYEDTFETAI